MANAKEKVTEPHSSSEAIREMLRKVPTAELKAEFDRRREELVRELSDLDSTFTPPPSHQRVSAIKRWEGWDQYRLAPENRGKDVNSLRKQFFKMKREQAAREEKQGKS